MDGNQDPEWLHGIEGIAARRLIEAQDRLVCVIAGPGTGKTTCLKRRTQRMLEGDKLQANKLHVGTFTRATAAELRTTLGPSVSASTLHAHAYSLLSQHPPARQGRPMRFLLSFEQDVLLYDIKPNTRDLADIHDLRRALRLMQAADAHRSTYDDDRFRAAVDRWLHRYQAMLVGEVISLCVSGLENDDIPAGQFDHVVIDEYQDLTPAEQELVSLIWSESGSMTVMGDPNQAIYGFRYNDPQGLRRFGDRWHPEPVADVELIDNRRSGRTIVDAANLVMNEAATGTAPMRATRSDAGTVHVVQWPKLADEIRGLASYIAKRPDESFLVLVPRRFIGHRLAQEIGPDAHTAFSEEVLQRPRAQEAFTALAMISDSDDWVAARVWLGFRGSASENAAARNAPAVATLPTNVGGHELIRRIASNALQIRGNGSKNVRQQAKRGVELIGQLGAPHELVDLLFAQPLRDPNDTDEQHQWLMNDFEALRLAAHDCLRAGSSPDLRDVVAELRYRIATRSALIERETEPKRVEIMTLHSAKGLEAPNVIIAGAADQIIPGSAENEEEREEQRRLLYVALTRARDSVVVSWSRAMPMSDAGPNFVRNDKIRTIDGEACAVLSRSTLIPRALTAVRGEEFLR